MIIFETNFWIIELLSDQAYLGRAKISLKRRCLDLAGLNKEEINDFLEIVKKYELAVKQAFSAVTINWTCAINASYLNNPPNPQVHWNARPRYKEPVEFAREIFLDKNFGKHYELGSREVSNNVLIKIAKKIKEGIS